MKVYYVRHQAAGIVADVDGKPYAFKQQPNDMQLAALKRICIARHGEIHKKRDTEWWMKVVEADVIGNEVPAIPEPETTGSLTASGKAELSGPRGSGSATVRNPE